MKPDDDFEDMSYQGLPDEEDKDVERRVWTPTELQLARYRKRDLELAASNLDLLASRGVPRHKRVITNGRAMGDGYCAIGVWVGGSEPSDTLHSLATFGRATARPATPVRVAFAGVARVA